MALLLGAPLGCRCQDEESSKPKEPPTPLVASPAPSHLDCSIHPAIGATAERPVLVVAAEDPVVCTKARKVIAARGHVLCTDAAPEKVEGALREGLHFLKKTYGSYVAPAPVVLVTDAERSRVGFRLMLQEPAFFALAYLPGLQEKAFTATSLAALHEQGARILALDLEPTRRLKLLASVAERRGLSVVPLGRKVPLEEVLPRLLRSDGRWTAPPSLQP